MLLVYVCSGEGAASSQDARRLLLLDGHRLLPTRRRALTNAPRLVTEVIARTRGFCALQARSSSLRCVAKRLCRSQCKVARPIVRSLAFIRKLMSRASLHACCSIQNVLFGFDVFNFNLRVFHVSPRED